MLNSKFDLYKREWLDLVFADRNKSYGAYDLRVHHGQYVMRAMGITLACFAVGVLAVKIFNKPQDQVIYKTDIVELHKYVPLPPENKQEEVHVAKVFHAKTAAAKPAPHVRSQVFTIPVPTDKPVPEVKMPPQSTLTNPSSVESKGEATPQTTIVDSQPGTTSGTPCGTAVAPDNTTYEAGVDVMPEPTGGMAAWAKFLQRNIRYPDTDSEGKVYMSFIVEKDGHLSNITLIKGVSTLLDDEALRVLRIAPNWKPGKQNGQAVRVKYTLPIVFQVSQ